MAQQQARGSLSGNTRAHWCTVTATAPHLVGINSVDAVVLLLVERRLEAAGGDRDGGLSLSPRKPGNGMSGDVVCCEVLVDVADVKACKV